MEDNPINSKNNYNESRFPSIRTIFTSDNNIPKRNTICIVDSLFAKCNICLLFYTELYYTDKCKHYLCKECMKAWTQIKKECPVCKQKFFHFYKK